ncbi:hypothetical protein TNCV_4859231 [Trichonephila clavipes]|nr:hypothetical protein TNCV_4859231 [Trichonephila clavipes]
MDAVICFNDGYVSRIKVFEALGIKPGYNTERALLIIDNKRIFEAERIVNKVSLEARNKRRSLKRKMDTQNLDEENEYQAGNINHIYNIRIATHGRKRLRSAPGGIVHKCIQSNRPILPQSYKLLSPAEDYGTFYKHRAGRYAYDLWIGRRKCTSSRNIVLRKVPTDKYTGLSDIFQFSSICVHMGNYKIIGIARTAHGFCSMHGTKCVRYRSKDFEHHVESSSHSRLILTMPTTS